MNELAKELVDLIDKLKRSNFVEDSVEHIALSHLKGLMGAAERGENTRALKAGFADLNQFWVSSVAWCSELSKDLEKIIIMYEEQQ
jgi:hypothetical protein